MRSKITYQNQNYFHVDFAGEKQWIDTDGFNVSPELSEILTQESSKLPEETLNNYFKKSKKKSNWIGSFNPFKPKDDEWL